MYDDTSDCVGLMVVMRVAQVLMGGVGGARVVAMRVVGWMMQAAMVCGWVRINTSFVITTS